MALPRWQSVTTIWSTENQTAFLIVFLMKFFVFIHCFDVPGCSGVFRCSGVTGFSTCHFNLHSYASYVYKQMLASVSLPSINDFFSDFITFYYYVCRGWKLDNLTPVIHYCSGVSSDYSLFFLSFCWLFIIHNSLRVLCYSLFLIFQIQIFIIHHTASTPKYLLHTYTNIHPLYFSTIMVTANAYFAFFAVSCFVFAVRFFLWQRVNSVYRGSFSFEVTVVGHRIRTVYYLLFHFLLYFSVLRASRKKHT